MWTIIGGIIIMVVLVGLFDGKSGAPSVRRRRCDRCDGVGMIGFHQGLPWNPCGWCGGTGNVRDGS